MLDNVTGEAKYSNPYMESLKGILSGETITRQLLNVTDEFGLQYQTSGRRAYIADNFVRGEGNYSQRLMCTSFATANVWFTAFVDTGLIEDPNAPTTTTTTTTTTTVETTTTAESTGYSNSEILIIF